MNRIFIYILALTSSCIFISCSKYLETKPDKSLSTPSTIKDLQLLLDDFGVFNSLFVNRADLLSDNYYVSDDLYESVFDNSERLLYKWQEDLATAEPWTEPYRTILQANVILDELSRINASETDANQIRGQALFFRAYYFWGLAQLFANPFSESSASRDLGIPLRTSSNVNEVFPRANVKDTYDRIVTDLRESITYLDNIITVRSRASKSAACGALAKVYLSKKQYDSAGYFANMCIEIYGNKLIEYNNDLDFASYKPIPDWQSNKEIIVPISSPYVSIVDAFFARVDSVLYQSYDDHDLRKKAFFIDNGDNTFSYNGNIFGIGSASLENRSIMINEMYLIRAESNARKGDKEEALKDLNYLLSKRWETGFFVPLEADTPQKALELILNERRKELPFTGSRWSDLRRLKDDPLFSITPKRVLKGETFLLSPDSKRYTLKIPQVVIDRGQYEQNN